MEVTVGLFLWLFAHHCGLSSSTKVGSCLLFRLHEERCHGIHDGGVTSV